MAAVVDDQAQRDVALTNIAEDRANFARKVTFIVVKYSCSLFSVI